MSTKKIIVSLLGKRLQLLDDSLFEQVTFWPDHVIHLFGQPGGTAGVCGPAWEYVVTLRGGVRFHGGIRSLAFSWDKLELQGNHLLVKCGRHSRRCSSFYRTQKTFVVGESDVANGPG
jgi:hypothetical protein